MANNIIYTIKHDLCTGCGICVGVCLKNAIKIECDKGSFLPKVDAHKCNNCGLCLNACPGVGIDLKGMADSLFQDKDIVSDRYIGKFLQCYTGYSNDYDMRYHAASGGLTSQFLIWLLENKIIDGAVVTKFDATEDYKVKTFIATTKDEIISARSSKYAPVSHHDSIKLIKNASGDKYVVVGLPCHIHGLRKAMKIDKRLNNKIVGLFSLYCSSGRSFNFTEYVMKERDIDFNKVKYLSYRDNGCLGGLVVKGDGIDYYQDYQIYCNSLRSIFVPRRCLFCIDHYGELADMSFGDIHIEPFIQDKVGINSVVVRSNYWNTFLEQASSEGAISLKPLSADVLNSSQQSAKMKKNRNVHFAELNKSLGRVVPDYGFQVSKHLDVKALIQYVHNRVQQFFGSHRNLWVFIPLIKKNTVVK